ncbi:MAG: hypothetical protein PWQ55_1233 [Chloroflexota bacterium]|nr:hypothetical protein [Chloroflexota bacterium]
MENIDYSELSLNYFKELINKYDDALDIQSITIELITLFHERAVISGSNHLYYDPYLIVQLSNGNRGTCFIDPGEINESDLNKIAGNLAFDIIDRVPRSISIAILDSLFQGVNRLEKIRPRKTENFNGACHIKSKYRANQIINQLEIQKGDKVLLIGVVEDIVRKLNEINADVCLADFSLAGEIVEGLYVNYDAFEFIPDSKIIIMTGNTLKTDTLGILLESINRFKKKVLIYAMTASNIAPRYLNYGVNFVTTENFPFYWYANIESSLEYYY